MNENIDLIERNSKAIELLAEGYTRLRSLGVESFAIDEIPKACAKLAKQIEVQDDAETAVRKP